MSKSETNSRLFSKGRKRLWWLTLVTAVLGLLCAALFNSIRTPLYETTTTVEVVDPSSYYKLSFTSVGYRDFVPIGPISDEIAQRLDLTLRNAEFYDEVAQRLDLTGGSQELEEAVYIQIPGYNPQMVDWVTSWRQRLLATRLANWLPRSSLPPPNIEIRVRHTDPLTTSEIGQTLVDVSNESYRDQIDEFLITGIAYVDGKLHSTLIELTIVTKTQNSEAEQATLLKELDMLTQLRSHVIGSLLSPTFISPPLIVVDSPSVPSSPIHTRSNLLLGASAGALLGFALLAIKRKRTNPES